MHIELVSELVKELMEVSNSHVKKQGEATQKTGECLMNLGANYPLSQEDSQAVFKLVKTHKAVGESALDLNAAVAKLGFKLKLLELDQAHKFECEVINERNEGDCCEMYDVIGGINAMSTDQIITALNDLDAHDFSQELFEFENGYGGSYQLINPNYQAPPKLYGIEIT
ncbi:hypothetical protein ACMXYX_17905 (plasmid) [Neptuniibacter sp. QD72_48]|uniref:hypothetical protein n=1 Tax=Neptuniibacter sp. QD72_48 TaxID=3398214 RepID=UPI0039F51FE3